jgi:mRNA interferase MazF
VNFSIGFSPGIMPFLKKDFQKWHAKMALLDDQGPRLFFHEREIWFCHLGANIGFEQDGKGKLFGRPVIIFRKFNQQVF